MPTLILKEDNDNTTIDEGAELVLNLDKDVFKWTDENNQANDLVVKLNNEAVELDQIFEIYINDNSLKLKFKKIITDR